MIGVILAAGMASRLRPLTDDCPKCLLRIGRSSLLQRTIDALRAAGINELVVVTGYLGRMIQSYVEESYSSDMTIHFVENVEYQTTNNIYSLWLTRPFTEGKEILLLDSDILFDAEIVKRVLDADGTVLAMNRHELGEEEIKVITDEKGRVVELSKTCPIEKALGESVGIEKMEAAYTIALFAELERMIVEERMVDVFYEQAFERLIPQGLVFRVVDTTDLFSVELDTVEDFSLAQRIIPPSLY